MSVSDLSNRGSYLLLNRLNSQGLITITTHVLDKRVRKRGLADKANIAEFILG